MEAVHYPAYGIKGSATVSGTGQLIINVLRGQRFTGYVAGISKALVLEDTASAEIKVNGKDKGTHIWGAFDLELNGSGKCEITLTDESNITKEAVRNEPKVGAKYKVEGAWDDEYVKYYQ